MKNPNQITIEVSYGIDPLTGKIIIENDNMTDDLKEELIKMMNHNMNDQIRKELIMMFASKSVEKK